MEVATLGREHGGGTAPPAALTSLIGRSRALDGVRSELGRARLVTLTGAGGVGKTRLALEAARSSAPAFPAGTWWVELTTVVDPKMVDSTLVRLLGVRPLPGVAELDAAAAFLGEGRTLLVLDNCEQVVERVAEVAEVLLRACPSLTIMATSRVALAVGGETRWEVSPLSISADNSAEVSDAVTLFIDRAGRIDGSRPIDGSSAQAVAEICRRLDGIPLAIELAATRLLALSPEEIARDLEDALGFLTVGSRTADARHRTLRGSLDWSFALLPEDARILLRRLGAFTGGCTLELAREVCVDRLLERAEVLATLEILVEHSLVRVESAGTVVRYTMLETVRQYALEQLERAGEREGVSQRHADAFVDFAERLRRELITPRQPEVLAALDPEASNLEAAFERELVSRPEQALRLCLALDFWYRERARFREADLAYGKAVAASDPPPLLRARALAAWAWIVGSWGDFDRGRRLAADGLALAEEAGDEETIAITLLALANLSFFTDPPEALELLRRCRELASAVEDDYVGGRSEILVRGTDWFKQDEPACSEGADDLRIRLERLGDRETLAWFWFAQGAVLYPLGAHDEARARLRRAVAAAAEIGEPTAERAAAAHLALIDLAGGDASGSLAELLVIHRRTLLHGGSFALPWIEVLVAQAEAGCDRLDASRARLSALVEVGAWGVPHPLIWAQAELAEVLRLLGSDDESRAQAELALAGSQQLGNGWLEAKSRLTLGRLAAAREEWTAAAAFHHEALAAIWEQRYALELPGALEALAEVAAGWGDHAGAGRILGAAARARRELGFVAWPARCADLDQLGRELGSALGEEALETARAEGGRLSRDDAVAWVRRGRGERRRPAGGWESLTPAEIEVVRHAVAGLTNPQIGERLFVSRATVKAHLAHVYAKLDLRNRSELAAKAAGRFPPVEKER